MKGNSAPAMNDKDFARLQAVLEKIATFAPGEGYVNWESIARDGADAARVLELDAVRAACRGCHSQYRDKYKHEMRGRPLPA
jgi:hypothetical protein